MGMTLQGHNGGFIDGGFDVNTSTTAYHAGMPLKINTSGTLELCLCFRNGYDDGYVGLARNHSGSTSDTKSDIYNGKAAYITFPAQVKLDNDDATDPADAYPWDVTRVYVPGDDLYINEVGYLTNVAPGGGGAVYDDVCANGSPIAIVMVVDSGGTYLIINLIR